jgi:hypothetical protein
MLRSEALVAGLEADEAADQQARAGQQHKGERELRAHQAAQQPALPGGSNTFFQRIIQACA